MSQSKTEKPTPRKQCEARRKGNVAFSTDISAAAALCAGFAVMAFCAGLAFTGWVHLLDELWSPDGFNQKPIAANVLSKTLKFILKMSSAVMFPVLAAGILAGFIQVGPLVRKLTPDLSRLNPVKGFRNLFTARKMIELIKTSLKFFFTLSILAWLIWDRLHPMCMVQSCSIESMVVFLCSVTGVFLRWSAALMVLYGLFDYPFQKHWWLKDLKMTRQEIQKEHKDSEGDPLLKSLRKQQYQEILHAGLSERITRSRLVVVNPTRYAVAIEYDEQWPGAPRVSAKGFMDSATRIRAMASRKNVPVLRHPPLARRLYELAVDQEIPEELFRAVAELLVFILTLHPEDRKQYR